MGSVRCTQREVALPNIANDKVYWQQRLHCELCGNIAKTLLSAVQHRIKHSGPTQRAHYGAESLPSARSEYKSDITRTNHRNAAYTLMARERLRKTIELGVVGACYFEYPKVHQAFMDLQT